MSERDDVIKSAIAAGADNADPLWKYYYGELASILLTEQQYVSGDDLKYFCRMRGLWEPDTHNRWGSMLAVLTSKGWIEPLNVIKPHRNHNHMNSVTFYRSTLFDPEEQWLIPV